MQLIISEKLEDGRENQRQFLFILRINSVVSDNLRSVKDAWIIGDHLARIAYPYLQQIDEDHKKGKCNYLHEHYDTYAYYPCFTDSNVLSMIRNSCIEGLNRRQKLPNVIIILCSDQFILENPVFLPSELEKKIKWVIRELIAAIQIGKDIMPSKCFILGEPRFMWVRACPNTKANLLSLENLLKFNNILRRLCISKAIYTIDITLVHHTNVRCFEFDGKTQVKAGFNDLWHDIIQAIKTHDSTDKEYEGKFQDSSARNYGKSKTHHEDKDFRRDGFRGNRSPSYKREISSRNHRRASSSPYDRRDRYY